MRIEVRGLGGNCSALRPVHKNNYFGEWMKGLAPVIMVIFVILAISLVAEGVFLTNYIAQIDPVRRAVQEIEVVQGINILEALRNAVEKSLDYSFYQAVYDGAKRG